MNLDKRFGVQRKRSERHYKCLKSKSICQMLNIF
ncbi:hypothetical protein AbauAttikon1_0069 [Acinetobacter phage Abau_Attikon1]